MPPAEPSIASHMKDVLEMIGEDPSRDGLVRTPERWEKAMKFLTSGYHTDMKEIVNGALFDVKFDEMVLVKDIEFFSLCEHHMLPFSGRAHVAYLPKGKVVGLSKLARVVEVYARRLQVQERMTRQIAEALQNALEPQGVAVVLEASHSCMAMRGVKKAQAVTVTSTMLGAFRSNPVTRAELMQLIARSPRVEPL